MKSSNYFNNFLKAEDENTKKTLREFRKEFELYERSFDLLCETLGYLYKWAKPDRTYSTAKFVILSILPRIVQTMQSIRLLTLKGYYYDTAVLERSLVESIGLCAYFALNEKEAENWFKGNDVKIAKIRLPDYIPLLLRVKSEDLESAKSVYGKLSEYVHTNIKAIVSLVTNFNDKSTRVSFAVIPSFSKEKVTINAGYPLCMLCMLVEIFRDELTKKRREKILRSAKQCLTEMKE